ncbi:Clp protease N-terminal domain-containing protein [Kineosporia sp. NBRC 101731]|uniref:Clp protease N-terminal domain-containing protein n=1 Tax=Kineosporia sp. NBRC 101731 TaxID=3032199 RepID=UPI0024A490F8|nr:Clp protease N-terminal domain-containing protein [Kineosporia sp. NBRC 101731]GLY28638.1 hypothetical protein Kisp02_20030 [Kineosporia sp. NBRC 101731]
MTDSRTTTDSVRLDDLIRAIKSAHTEPLEQLSGAVVVGDYLGEVADHLIGHFVDQARRSGASWTEIGTSMGVSKQAVQKRFVVKADVEPLDMSAGFKRFTPRARDAVVQSQTAARDASSDHIGLAHLFLGLAAVPDTLALKALDAQGVTSAQLIEAATAVLPEPAADVPALIPYDAAAKKVLELTLRTALRLGHNYVGTEHILLALAEHENGTGLLGQLGVATEKLEADVQRLLGELAP